MCEVNVKLQRDDLIAAHFDVGKCPHLMFGCRYDHGGRTYTPVTLTYGTWAFRVVKNCGLILPLLVTFLRNVHVLNPNNSHIYSIDEVRL